MMVLHKMRGFLFLGNLCTVIHDEGGLYLDVALRPFLSLIKFDFSSRVSLRPFSYLISLFTLQHL